MLESEAEWIEKALAQLPPGEISSIVNLGSSTNEFRTKVQPYIEETVFYPIEKSGMKVHHVDIKQGPGIDLTADPLKEDELIKIQNLGGNCVLCCNMMEHVVSPQALVQSLDTLLGSGGYLILTVPFSFPYHPDPIDNMFRPTPERLSDMFPNFKVLEKAIVPCGTLFGEFLKRRISLPRMIFRSLIPFYRFKGWIFTLHNWTWLLRDYKVSCVLMQKR